MSKPRMRRPAPSPGASRPTGNSAALRRRAEACREQADALERMLEETQAHFGKAFAAADAQRSTRDRIADAARGGRKLGAVHHR